MALCIETARSGARILTPILHASLFTRAFGANNAFGSTVGRDTDVIREARTRRIAGDYLAL